MSNSNKEFSDDEIIKKDTRIEFRINAAEKEIFETAAKEKNMTLSEYIISTLRGEILKEKIIQEIAPAGGKGDNSIILKRIDQLEQALNQNLSENLSVLKELSAEYREDLLLYNTRDKVYWMLQQERFQKKTHREIKDLLIQEDKSLKEYLEETPKRMFTALDLALEKLHEEGRLILSDRGKIQWNK